MRQTSKKRSTPSQKSEVPDATFVFKGTIKKLKASNVSQAPAGERTAVVTIDQAIDAPPNLAAYTGQDITVQLSGQRKVKSGEKLIFHATPWLYAENLAVRSLQEDADSVAGARQANGGTRQAQREVRKRFDAADMVISGKVVAVRLPQKSAGNTRKAAAREQTTTHVSEHDPKWREAIIEVEKVHKGTPTKRQVIVRFPASNDVAWRRAPKFQAGQQGYFVLHKDNPSLNKRAVTKANARAATQTYTVRDMHDFQPYAEAGGIRSIIDSD
jgi:hypothetical protein